MSPPLAGVFGSGPAFRRKIPLIRRCYRCRHLAQGSCWASPEGPVPVREAWPICCGDLFTVRDGI